MRYPDEYARLLDWSDRHRRLVARLLVVLVLTLIVDAIGTMLEYYFERHARGTDIHSVGDAAFFTTVQILTVSSQIRNPFTVGGRIVDVLLETWAVLVVAGAAGSITSFLMSAND